VVREALVQDLTVETTATQIMLEQANLHCIGFVAGGVSESDLVNITVKPVNLAVKRQTSAGTGWFGGVAGDVSASRLKEIAVIGAGSSLSFQPEIQWTSNIGGIAGCLDAASEISGSIVSLNIGLSTAVPNGEKSLGGLVGSNTGTIRESSYSGTLASSFIGTGTDTPHANTGGIAGINTGTIEACYASPRITTVGTNTTNVWLYTGGLAGANTGTIRNSYAACGIGITITTTNSTRRNIYSGGVAGGRLGSASSGGQIEKCYAAGSLQTVINGTIYSYDEVWAGGISGEESYRSDSVSSSAALVSAITSDPSGLGAGSSSRIAAGVTLTNNIAFNNMLVNGSTVTDAVTDPQNGVNGLGKTAAQLKSQASYTALGWDFADVWKMGPTAYPYPILQWQDAADLPPPGFELLAE
jgi:hypothetical protein